MEQESDRRRRDQVAAFRYDFCHAGFNARLNCAKALFICLLNRWIAPVGPSAPKKAGPPLSVRRHSYSKVLILTANHGRILTNSPIPSTNEKIVFISGSAYEYGSLGDEGKDLIRNLTRSLLRNDFKIITGFGSGVGNHVVESALHEIYGQPGKRLADQIRIFPFPIANGSDRQPELESLHRNYRNDMMAQADSAIFLFGNKLEDIAVRESDGMRAEYEIARSNGMRIIPVGVSGYISAALWNEVVDHYDDYVSDRSIFDSYLRLGDPGAGQAAWIDAILEIADSAYGQKESIHQL